MFAGFWTKTPENNLELQILKEGGLTPAAKLIRAIYHVYDAEMRWYTHENMFIMFWKHLSLPKQLFSKRRASTLKQLHSGNYEMMC